MSEGTTINELMAEYWRLEGPVERIALVEEAIRLADSHGDVSQGYELRMQLIHVATFNDFHEKAMVAFAWCLAEFDRNPDRYDAWQLLWKFKWILGNAYQFPNVSKQQVLALHDDMERRLRELNYSLRPLYCLRWNSHMYMGELEAALEYHALWKAAPNDALADCAACEANKEVRLMAVMHRDQQSLTLAAPLLAGRMSCATVPQSTYGVVMRPLLRSDQLDRAGEVVEMGHRKLLANPIYLSQLAEMQLYFIRSQRLVKAINTLEKCLKGAMQTTDQVARYQFYWSAALLLEALVKKGKKVRKLRLPANFACHRDDSQYDLAELSQWFAQQAGDIAEQFNRRNCNDFCTRIMQESRELTGL